MKSMKRKGFTLVELLIVIVVIGILAAMMMLSSTEAVTSSKVNNITSNLRNLKTAALSFYTDSYDNITADQSKAIDLKTDVVPYLSSGATIPDIDDYSIVNFAGDWYIYYDVQSTRNTATEQPKIKAKLKARAKSLGLYGASDTASTKGRPDVKGAASAYGFDGDKRYVVIRVR